jgi:hypothetical protein
MTGKGQIEFNTLESAMEALPKLHGRIARNGSRILLSYSRPRRSGNAVKSRSEITEFLLRQPNKPEFAP